MSSATVLVVDDNADFLELVRLSLESAGHTVHVASDGVQALAMMRVRPDLVLVDITMPGMSGSQLVDELGRLEGVPPFGVIAISGRVDARNSPTKWFLSKPVSLELLLGVVGDFSSRRRAAPASGVCAVAEAVPAVVEPGRTGTNG